MPRQHTYDLVIAANRLPVDRVLTADGPELPEGSPLIRANDGASISEQLEEHGLL